MKKSKIWTGMLVLLLAFAMAFMGCPDPEEKVVEDENLDKKGDGTTEQEVPFELSEASEKLLTEISDILKEVKEQEQPKEYTITLTEDIPDFPGIGLNDSNLKLTIKGNGKTISWRLDQDNRSTLFSVQGSNLILEDITIKRVKGNTLDWAVIGITEGGSLEMKQGAVFDGDNESYGGVIWLGGPETKFTLSGGEIRNHNNTGIVINADNAEININDGKITNTSRGIALWDGKNTTINMTGGEISGSTYEGIIFGGGSEESKLNMSGGRIINNKRAGIHIEGKEQELNITDGEINNNDWVGIFLKSDDSNVSISGGKINYNGEGFLLEGTGNTVNITGGVIAGGVHHGIFIKGTKNLNFSIEGATINDRKGGWAIRVTTENDVDLRNTADRDIESADKLTLKTNSNADITEYTSEPEGLWKEAENKKKYELPDPVGENEVKGKSYEGESVNESSSLKIIFEDNETYTIFEIRPSYDDLTFENGFYSWDEQNKTVTILAEKKYTDWGMVDIDELRDLIVELDLPEEFNNYVEAAFSPKTYNYEITDDVITLFSIKPPLTETSTEIAGCGYSNKASTGWFGMHYLLSISFEDASQILTNAYGSPQDSWGIQSFSSLATPNLSAWVILEFTIYGDMRLHEQTIYGTETDRVTKGWNLP